VEGSWVVSGAAEVAGAVASCEVGACEVAGAASEERNVSISSWQIGGTVKASRSVCSGVCLCVCAYVSAPLQPDSHHLLQNLPKKDQWRALAFSTRTARFALIIPSSSYHASSHSSSLSRLEDANEVTPDCFRPPISN
jgi:hypothetical protein